MADRSRYPNLAWCQLEIIKISPSSAAFLPGVCFLPLKARSARNLRNTVKVSKQTEPELLRNVFS